MPNLAFGCTVAVEERQLWREDFWCSFASLSIIRASTTKSQIEND